MQLTKSTRLQRHDGGGNGLGRRKVARVDNMDGAAAARGVGRRLLTGVVDVRGRAGEFAVGRRDGLVDDAGVQDVRVGRGGVGEDGGIDAYPSRSAARSHGEV